MGFSPRGLRESDTTQQQRAPPKPGLGDSPSFPLPASGLASILGLWPQQSSLCLYPHGASPPQASLPSSRKDTSHLGTGAPSAQLITTDATCNNCFQTRPHSQAEDVDMLGGHGLQPLIPTIVCSGLGDLLQAHPPAPCCFPEDSVAVSERGIAGPQGSQHWEPRLWRAEGRSWGGEAAPVRLRTRVTIRKPVLEEGTRCTHLFKSCKHD